MATSTSATDVSHSKHRNKVTVFNYILYSAWAQVLQVFIIIISLSFPFFSIIAPVNQSVKKFGKYFKRWHKEQREHETQNNMKIHHEK